MDTWSNGKNEPKTNPNEPKLKNAKMNVNNYIIMDYENISNWAICENEPNQSQNEPNSSRRSLWQSRNKTNFI